MSNKIAENLFSAIDIQIENKLQGFDCAKTIIATVEGRIDPNAQYYRISYQDSIFEAEAFDGAAYQQGQSVKVLVSNNATEQMRTIIGLASAREKQTFTESALYTDLGKSIVNDNEEDLVIEYEFTSGTTMDLYNIVGTSNYLTVDAELLEKHLKESSDFSIGADVYANIEEGKTAELVFELKKADGSLDEKSLSFGRNYLAFKSCKKYFDDIEFVSINKIFIRMNGNLELTEEIKIKNISFNIVEKNEGANALQLVIHGYEGNVISDDMTQLTVEARLMQGVIYLDPDDVSYEWYRENPFESSGWEDLGNEYKTAAIQLTRTEVYLSAMKFKAVATYGDVKFEAITVIKNVNGQSAIYSFNKDYLKDESQYEVNLQLEIIGTENNFKWFHTDVYKNEEKLSSYENNFNITVQRTSNYNYYKVYIGQDNRYLGYAEITLSNDKLTGFYEDGVEFAFTRHSDRVDPEDTEDTLWADKIGKINNTYHPYLWKRVIRKYSELDESGMETIFSTIDVVSLKNRCIAHIKDENDGTDYIWHVYYTNGFIAYAYYSYAAMGSSGGGYNLFLSSSLEGEKEPVDINTDVTSEYKYLWANDIQGTNADYKLIAEYGTANYSGSEELTFMQTSNSKPRIGVEESSVVFGKTDLFYKWAITPPDPTQEINQVYKTSCPYINKNKLHYADGEGWSDPIVDYGINNEGVIGNIGNSGQSGKAAKGFDLLVNTYIYSIKTINNAQFLDPSEIIISANFQNFEESEQKFYSLAINGIDIIVNGSVLPDFSNGAIKGVEISNNPQIITLKQDFFTYLSYPDTLQISASADGNSILDACVIKKIESGTSPFNIVFSNQNITFDSSSTKPVEVIASVYRGMEKIKSIFYDNSLQNVSNNHPYVALFELTSSIVKNEISIRENENDLYITVEKPFLSKRHSFKVYIVDNVKYNSWVDNPERPLLPEHETILNTTLNCIVYNGNFEVRLSNPELTFDKYASDDEYQYQEIIATLGIQSLVDYSGATTPTSGYYIIVEQTAKNISKEGSAGNNMYKVTKPDKFDDKAIYTVKLYAGSTFIEDVELTQTYKEGKFNNKDYKMAVDQYVQEVKLDNITKQPLGSSPYCIFVASLLKKNNSISGEPIIQIDSPSNEWKQGEHYDCSYSNGKLELKIKKLPINTTGNYNFTIIWKSDYGTNPDIYDSKQVTLKLSYAETDYTIIVPNSIDITSFGANTTGTQAIKVRRRVDGEEEELTKSGVDSNITLYQTVTANEITQTERPITGDWKISYGVLTESIVLTLKTNDDSKRVLDEKVVNFVFNGSEYELTTYKAFNALTNKGELEGTFYSLKKAVTYGDTTYEAGTPVYLTDENEYVIENTAQTVKEEDVGLYISATMIKTGTLNADLIKTGSLSITNKDKEILFSAGMDKDKGNVQIGGFNVIGDTLSAGTNKAASDEAGVHISPKKIEIGSGGEVVFSVDDLGRGQVAGWNFTNSGFTSQTSVTVQADIREHIFYYGGQSKNFDLSTNITQIYVAMRVNGTTVTSNTFTGSQILPYEERILIYGIGAGNEIQIKYKYSASENNVVVYVDTIYAPDEYQVSLYVQIKGSSAENINITPSLNANGTAVFGSITLGYEPSIISDNRFKKNIHSLNTQDEVFNSFLPCSYSYIYDENEKTRFGFIVQDVEKAFEQQGLDVSKYGLIQTNEDGYKSLAYTEFIALNTHEIQKLKKRTSDLEARLEALEKKINQT